MKLNASRLMGSETQNVNQTKITLLCDENLQFCFST